MSIARNKKRIQISLTEEQDILFENVAKEMGITKSNLIQIATMQYVNAYNQSKSVISTAFKEKINQMLEGKEIDIEKLRSENIF